MIVIEVCVGSTCHMRGSYNVINALQNIINNNNLSDKFSIKAAFCLGECTKAVCVRIEGYDHIYAVKEQKVDEFFKEVVEKYLKK